MTESRPLGSGSDSRSVRIGRVHGSRDLTKNHVIRPPGGEALMTYGMIRHLYRTVLGV